MSTDVMVGRQNVVAIYGQHLATDDVYLVRPEPARNKPTCCHRALHMPLPLPSPPHAARPHGPLQTLNSLLLYCPA